MIYFSQVRKRRTEAGITEEQSLGLGVILVQSKEGKRMIEVRYGERFEVVELDGKSVADVRKQYDRYMICWIGPKPS